MKPGAKFETKCYEYLKDRYQTKDTVFYHEGGMDSTKSDIAVMKNGRIIFYIEAKDSLAQSGQFVLLPNESTETFVFSSRNRSKPNEMTDMMIEYMNCDFSRFNHAGTSGQALEIDTNVFAEWIISYYKNKNVKYVISYGESYIIVPIHRFHDYFQIKANYRIKKSGSGVPAQRDYGVIKEYIKSLYQTAKFTRENKELYVEITEPIERDRFVLGKYTYYLSEQDKNQYAVRRLSNTYNMNVIFSIALKKSQDIGDLEAFESELYCSL